MRRDHHDQDVAELNVRDLVVEIEARYGSVRAVDGVSLRAAPGEVHAVIGASGSGKSTVLDAVSGALPRNSTMRGEINLRLGAAAQDRFEIVTPGSAHGRSLLPPTSPWSGRVIGVVPQSAQTALTPVRTLGAHVREVCAALGSDRDLEEILLGVGLDPADGSRYPHELSGGMAQRAAFALATVGEPPLLLADEPTSSLDPELTGHFMRALRNHADRGGTTLLVTHDVEELERAGIADWITVMHEGRIVESGAAHQILAAPTRLYTQLFLRALPTRGFHVPSAAQMAGALAELKENGT